MCTFFFSYKAIVPVHDNFILIAYAIIPKLVSIVLPLTTKMFSDSAWLYTARSHFGPSLHLNPYVLCAINMGSVDESMLFGNKRVSNAHVMV